MQDRGYNTPLYEACICANVVIVKELLHHHADMDAQNFDNKTPLQTACMGGYVEIVKAIMDTHEGDEELAKAYVERLKTTRMMHLAVENGNIKMVKLLLYYEVYPSMQKDSEVTAIHVAARQGYTDIATLLLDYVDTCRDFLDDQHRSLLHYAARNNQVAMIKLLLSK